MNSNGTPFTIFLSCVQNRQVLMSPPYTFPKSPSMSPMCSQPSLLLWLQDTHFFPPPLKSKGSLSLLPPLLVPSLSIPPRVLVLGVLKHRTLKVQKGTECLPTSPQHSCAMFLAEIGRSPSPTQGHADPGQQHRISQVPYENNSVSCHLQAY